MKYNGSHLTALNAGCALEFLDEVAVIRIAQDPCRPMHARADFF
jgi:uncharacterized protein (UPF0147 family)